MSFGKRPNEYLVTKMRRKRLAVLRGTYLNLRAGLQDPSVPINIATLKRIAVLKAVLVEEGVRV